MAIPSIQQRVIDERRGLTTLHEFSVLREQDYMADLLSGGRSQTIGVTERAGKCALCGEKTRAGAVRVVLIEQCGAGVSPRTVTLHKCCDRQIGEVAAEECLEANHQHTRAEDRAHFGELLDALNSKRSEAAFQEALHVG